ncbi:MAG: ABC transporter permease [Myxococcales bacterium]|nr:ABC transporter permease [Myxococcales bacterium]
MGDLFRETLRSLRAHRLRFALTSLGVVWGAFMLTFLSASMRGVEEHYTRELELLGPKVVWVFPGTVVDDRVGDRGARPVEIDAQDVRALASIHSIERAAPNVILRSQVVRVGRTTKLLSVQGVSHDTSDIRSYRVGDGRFLSRGDVERGERVAFLGAEAAARLFAEAPAVDRRIQIESVSFRVVGVAKPKGPQLIAVHGSDDLAVMIPYTTAQRLFVRSESLDQLVFSPRSRAESSPSVRHARELLGLRERFDPAVETALYFFNIQDILTVMARVFVGLRLFLFVAGIVTLLVGAIGVMNIMLVVVSERSNEIGVRKAVGASDREIFVQFLTESASVSTLSGLVGVVLGVGLSLFLRAHLPEDGMLGSPAVLDPAAVAVFVSSLVVVGIVAGLAPALRAARIDPSVTLRSA